MSFHVAALVLLASALWSHAVANPGDAIDCCLQTTDIPIPWRVVKTYFFKSINDGCPIPATVFVTKRNKKLCAPPASEKKWVAKLIKKLKRQAKNKARKNGKGRVKNRG